MSMHSAKAGRPSKPDAFGGLLAIDVNPRVKVEILAVAYAFGSENDAPRLGWRVLARGSLGVEPASPSDGGEGDEDRVKISGSPPRYLWPVQSSKSKVGPRSTIAKL